MDNTILSVKDISKSFSVAQEKLKVLDQINICVFQNECLCLLGYSGCGKTTLLRIICALESADSGSILLESIPYNTPSKDVLMLFQDFNQLLPWKTVLGNIVHSLCVTKLASDKKEAKSLAEDILKEVELWEFKDSYPSQLSGGMKQRAAFARAIVLKPKVLVMDEPFASLDYVIRKKLQELTRTVCKKHNITVIFVTHDIEEALAMADRIVVMDANPGRIKSIVENTYANTHNNEDKLALQTKIMRTISNID